MNDSSCAVGDLAQDGTFGLSYALVVAGDYSVQIRAPPSVDADVVLTVQPGYVSAAGTQVMLPATATAGDDGQFEIILRDVHRNRALCLEETRPCTPASSSCVVIFGSNATECGDPQEISVQAVDSIGRSDGLNVALSLEQNMTDVLEVPFSTNVSGSYAIIVTLNDRPLVQYTPILVVNPASTDPSSCVLGWPGGKQICLDNGRLGGCMINVTAYGGQFLSLVAKDQYGNIQNTMDDFLVSNPTPLSAVQSVGCNDPGAANFQDNST